MDVMRRPKGREVLSDDEIEQESKNRDHERKQKNLDSFANITRLAIYVIPTLLFLWVVIMALHYIFSGNWKAFESWGQTVIVYVSGYLTRYLQSIGVISEKIN